MIDLTTRTIKKLFEEQMRELTRRTMMPREDSFDFQFSGVWLR